MGTAATKAVDATPRSTASGTKEPAARKPPGNRVQQLKTGAKGGDGAQAKASGAGGPQDGVSEGAKSPMRATRWNPSSVKGKEEYAWWTLGAVEAAFERAKQANARFLTRNEFWQVFTDYTVLTLRSSKEAPKFLALSLSVFNLFAEECVVHGANLYIRRPKGMAPAGTKAIPSMEPPQSARSTRSTRSGGGRGTPRGRRGQQPKQVSRLTRGASSRSLARGGSSRSLRGSPVPSDAAGSRRGVDGSAGKAKPSTAGATTRAAAGTPPPMLGSARGKPGQQLARPIASAPGTARSTASATGSVASANDAAGGGAADAGSTSDASGVESASDSESAAAPSRSPSPKLGGRFLKKLRRAAKQVVGVGRVMAHVALPRVDVFEVMLVLILFCQGDAGAKLKTMFGVFDADDSGSMTTAEMYEFMRILAKASTKIGVLPAAPDEEVLLTLTAKMFMTADGDRSGTITCAEFVAWGQVHVLARGMLTAYDSVRREAEKKKQGSIMSIDPARGDNGKVSALQRVRALNKVMLATSKMMAAFKKSRQEFTVESLRALRERFMDLASTNLGHPTELTRKQFVALMHAEYPFLRMLNQPGSDDDSGSDDDDAAPIDDDVVQHLFAAFDADRSGTISFKELTLGLSKHMSGDFNTKLALLFEAFSSERDPHNVMAAREISVRDLQQLVKENNEEFTDVAQFAEDTIAALDKDRSGTLSLSEFKAAVETKPVLFQCVVQTAQQPQQLTTFKDAIMSASVKFRDVFTMAKLNDAWERAARDELGFNVDSMNLTNFRKFMVDEFQCPQALLPLCNRVFDALDADSDGMLTKRELFSGLAKIMSGERSEKAEFVFRLFDEDASGEMDVNEVMAMVISTQENVSQASAEASRLLRKLDVNGDGLVSFEEFKATCHREPQLLDCFAQMFGSSAIEDRSSATRAKKVATRILRTVQRNGEEFVEETGAKAMRRLSLFTAGRVVGQLMSQMKHTQDDARRVAAAAGGADVAPGPPPPLSPTRKNEEAPRIRMVAGDPSSPQLYEAKQTGAVTRAVGRAFADMLTHEVVQSRAALKADMARAEAAEEEERRVAALHREQRRAKRLEELKATALSKQPLVVTFGEVQRQKREQRMLSLRARAAAYQRDREAKERKAKEAAAKEAARQAAGSTSASSVVGGVASGTDGELTAGDEAVERPTDGGGHDSDASSASSATPERYYGSSNSSGDEGYAAPWRQQTRRKAAAAVTLASPPSMRSIRSGFRTHTGGTPTRSLTRSRTHAGLTRVPTLHRGRAAAPGASASPVRGLRRSASHAASPLASRTAGARLPRLHGASSMRIMTKAQQGSPQAWKAGAAQAGAGQVEPAGAMARRTNTATLFGDGEGWTKLSKGSRKASRRRVGSQASVFDVGGASDGEASAVEVWPPPESQGHNNLSAAAGATPNAAASSMASRFGDPYWKSKSQLTMASSERLGQVKRSMRHAKGNSPTASQLRAVHSLERQSSVTGRALSALSKAGGGKSPMHTAVGVGLGGASGGSPGTSASPGDGSLRGSPARGRAVSMRKTSTSSREPLHAHKVGRYTFVASSSFSSNDQGPASPPVSVASFFGRSPSGAASPEHEGTMPGGRGGAGMHGASPNRDSPTSTSAMQSELQRGLAVLDAVYSAHKTAEHVQESDEAGSVGMSSDDEHTLPHAGSRLRGAGLGARGHRNGHGHHSGMRGRAAKKRGSRSRKHKQFVAPKASLLYM